MATAPSYLLRRQPCWQGARQIRPKTPGKTTFSLTSAMASGIWAAATSRMTAGICIRAGQTRWQTEMQSPRWSLNSSSIAALRAAFTSAVSLATVMPWMTFVEQDGTKCASPLIRTTHAMHEGWFSFTPARKHKVGMLIPSFCAAVNTVLPLGTSSARPAAAHDGNGIFRAGHTANIAARAHRRVNLMPAVRRGGDGTDGAMLRANGAAGAMILHDVLNQRLALSGRATTSNVRFVFIEKMSQGREHRIRRGAAQTADTALGGECRQLPQFIEVRRHALASAKPVKNLEHAHGADAHVRDS